MMTEHGVYAIMPGVQIGDNVCIVAGAIVTKNIPSGEVWGGVSVKFKYLVKNTRLVS